MNLLFTSLDSTRSMSKMTIHSTFSNGLLTMLTLSLDKRCCKVKLKEQDWTHLANQLYLRISKRGPHRLQVVLHFASLDAHTIIMTDCIE